MFGEHPPPGRLSSIEVGFRRLQEQLSVERGYRADAETRVRDLQVPPQQVPRPIARIREPALLSACRPSLADVHAS